jgi:hypothetical protein
MDPKLEKVCKNCAAYESTTPTAGLCRRNAPLPITSTGESHHAAMPPMVSATFRCLEFTPAVLPEVMDFGTPGSAEVATSECCGTCMYCWTETGRMYCRAHGDMQVSALQQCTKYELTKFRDAEPEPEKPAEVCADCDNFTPREDPKADGTCKRGGSVGSIHNVSPSGYCPQFTKKTEEPEMPYQVEEKSCDNCRYRHYREKACTIEKEPRAGQKYCNSWEHAALSLKAQTKEQMHATLRCGDCQMFKPSNGQCHTREIFVCADTTICPRFVASCEDCDNFKLLDQEPFELGTCITAGFQATVNRRKQACVCFKKKSQPTSGVSCSTCQFAD